MNKTYCDICEIEIGWEEQDNLRCFGDDDFIAPGFIKNYEDESAAEFDFEHEESFSDLCNKCRKKLNKSVLHLIAIMKGSPELLDEKEES